MPQSGYNENGEEDLASAAEFRDIIHREALKIVRRSYPLADSVIDRYLVEAYFEDVWEYPGRWYTYVAVPKEAGGRKALIDTIVRDTIGFYRNGTSPAACDCSDTPGATGKPKGLERIFEDKPAGWGMNGDPLFGNIFAKTRVITR